MSYFILNPLATIIEGSEKYSIMESKGNWIKLPKETIEIILSIVESKIDENDITSTFVQQEDANYIKDIIEKLKSIQILYLDNESHNYVLESVQWAITNKCNLSCIHCCQDAESFSPSMEETGTINKKEKAMIAKFLCQIDSLQTISITGGEPLLCEECEELSTYIRANFKGKTILMTNGLMINHKNIEWIIKNFDHISISIDGSCPELTQMVRGEDIFDIVVSKIKLLKEYNFNDISMSAILPDADEVIIDFNNLCTSLQVDPMIRSYSMSGRGAHGFHVLMNKYDVFLKEKGFKQRSRLEDNAISGINRCSAGITQLTIEPNGNIQPCAVLWDDAFTLGNIRNMNIQDFLYLINDNGMFDFKGSKCEGCSYKNLCWHCYDEYIYYKRDSKIFNERCENRLNIIESILWED